MVPHGQRELASTGTEHTVDLGAELEALSTAPLTFPRSFRHPLCSISQLALTTLPLFDLRNLCFGSLFHTHSDSRLSPLKALGHLPGSEIQCEVKYSSDPHRVPINFAPPPSVRSILLGMHDAQAARNRSRRCPLGNSTPKYSLA